MTSNSEREPEPRRRSSNTVRYWLKDRQLQRLCLEEDDVLYIGDDLAGSDAEVLYIDEDQGEDH